MADYTQIWEFLHKGKNVLLLILSEGDPRVFDLKAASVTDWFSSIVKDKYGEHDYLMLNDTWLCIRKAATYPFSHVPQDETLQVITL